MPTIQERIKEIEDELKRTEYNKATEKHIGLLKAKLSKLETEMLSHRKGGGEGFAIPKSGDATVALVGYPNVGKSSILNALTDQTSETGNFAFTTLRVVPGILNYRGAQIQILDLPGIIENASSGAGRGREVLSIVRNADLVLLVTDVEAKGLDRIVNELHRAGIVLNRRRKNISLKKGNSGGIKIHKPKKVDIDDEQIRMVLKEFKITNADLFIRENVTVDDIIDYLRGSTVYASCLVAVNKTDLPYDETSLEPLRMFGPVVKVSAATGKGIEELKEQIFQSLSLIRVFLKDKSGYVDLERPMVLRSGATVRDVVRKISREMLQSFRYAILTGPGRKIGEQRVGLDFYLMDGDTITIISRN
ncbi:MAG TPA: GTP-binding protein [Thermoplasmataceae archaeon]|nr:GTP-binding protein [Thermoplasmataceae archaeon]